MILYLKNLDQGEKYDSYALVREAAADYLNKKQRGNFFYADVLRENIVRTDEGKPYFQNIPIHFSVSHTISLWGCLMADFNVGLDLQTFRNVETVKISKRFFLEEEADFVEASDEEIFFKLWARKEAFVKYTGKGFSGQGFANFSTIRKTERKTEFSATIEDAFVSEIELPRVMTDKKQIVGAYCAERREQLWLVTM